MAFGRVFGGGGRILFCGGVECPDFSKKKFVYFSYARKLFSGFSIYIKYTS
jgi:hypothetical protein